MYGALISFALNDELIRLLHLSAYRHFENPFGVGTLGQNVSAWTLFVFDTSR